MNLKIHGWIMSSIILDFMLDKICSCRHSFFFCKHIHLVISQLLDKIFQPLKEQKLCPSLGAPNFGVNSECFAQLLRIQSKTPNFWATKNSAFSLCIWIRAVIKTSGACLQDVVKWKDWNVDVLLRMGNVQRSCSKRQWETGFRIFATLGKKIT